jgi:hypothetical protein
MGDALMRNLTILAACSLAACSGGGEEKKVEAPAATMEAGQWQTEHQVTAHRSTDKTEPALKAAVGDKETGSACIAAGSEATPPAALFAGPGYDCTYKNSYIRGGRINAAMTCKRAGIGGEIMMSVDGTYTGTSFDSTVSTSTYLVGNGDFESSRKVSGRKTGPTCAPETPAAGGTGKKAA